MKCNKCLWVCMYVDVCVFEWITFLLLLLPRLPTFNQKWSDFLGSLSLVLFIYIYRWYWLINSGGKRFRNRLRLNYLNMIFFYRVWLNIYKIKSTKIRSVFSKLKTHFAILNMIYTLFITLFIEPKSGLPVFFSLLSLSLVYAYTNLCV